jgi:ABC-type microcin C transport system permease subunit YejB
MARIDPLRIGRIFQTLSKPSAQSAGQSSVSTAKQNTSKQQANASGNKPRSKEALKASMVSRLSRVDKLSDGYLNKATIIMVQEIMQWEFGEDIINHAEFNDIVTEIANTLLQHAQMKQTIQDALKQLKI